MQYSQLIFKIASHPDEFAQIHSLNYRTFVEEIPQHAPNPDKRLIDKFHHENTYYICLDGQRLVGMLAARAKRPFSIDDKVPDLDKWLPAGTHPCEFRLLAVEPEFRSGSVFADLLHFATSESIKLGYNLAVVSGTIRQARLYKRMGFVAFANPVGTEKALYQPMYLSLPSALSLFDRLKMEMPHVPEEISFLPGPVQISESVRKAFNSPAISHRSEAFMKIIHQTESQLCKLTNARYTTLFMGSGTLASDVIAAHLKILNGSGVILANGEFGERLTDHALRMGLKFKVLRESWGNQYNIEKIEHYLHKNPQIKWLWTTHCETSCSILNNIQLLGEICKHLKIKLCLDCTSSLGTVPLDLSGVYLASSVSGKGLASFAGLSMVFYNQKIEPNINIPRYLDLGFYSQKNGVPFTQSSNLVTALNQALLELDAPRRFETIRRQYKLIKDKLSSLNLTTIPKGENTSPAVITIQLPDTLSSLKFGATLERCGFMIYYRGEYLQKRNIIQICLLGKTSDTQCINLVETITEMLSEKRNPVMDTTLQHNSF